MNVTQSGIFKRFNNYFTGQPCVEKCDLFLIEKTTKEFHISKDF